MHSTKFSFKQPFMKWLSILSASCFCLASAFAQGVPASSKIETPVTDTAPAEHRQESPRSVVVDSIAVIVNKDVITMSELKHRIDLVTKQLTAQKVTMPPPEVLQKQVLERMIIESAQVQLAKDMGINVTDVQLDKTISMIAEKDGMTVSQLQASMEKKGESFEAFREGIRQEITMERLRNHEVASKIQINDAEVDALLGNDSMQPQAPQEIHLGHIMIRVPDNASPEQIAEKHERAEKVLKLLQSGGDFQENAAAFSDSEESTKGGDIGWRSTDRLPQAFTEALANVPTGGITGIIKSPNGFHILKVIERRESGNDKSNAIATGNAVQQIHARHILIKVNQLVSANEAKHKLVELKQRIINNSATFEELAKTFSNDTSASRGGDLGWIYLGDTVPEFEKAMLALNIGEISDPVETQFGFHLIQVLEKKTDDVSQERKRAIIKQKLRERKMVEGTEEWLRQLRDRVYVEYRFDNQQD